MVATRGTTAATGGKPESGSPKPNTTSLFGNEQPTNKTATPKGSKQKTMDLSLETITIDKSHDLTLIVGSPENSGGQKAFQVNKGSFRNASEVWMAMVNGNWLESGMSEIRFPDDSAFAFQIILRIAHWQVSELPASLTQEDMVTLAKLSDKYDTKRLLRAAFDLKSWLQPYKGTGATWPATIDLQDFTFITKAIGYDDDFSYLVNRLAMEVQVKNETYSYPSDSASLDIRSDFPADILAQVDQIRTDVLRELLQTCRAVSNKTLAMGPGVCGDHACHLRQLGVMMKGFDASGLNPLPENESNMHGSVVGYWTSLKKIGVSYNSFYMPRRCQGGYGNGSGGVTVPCHGYLDITTDVKATLKRYAHKDIWA